MLTPRLRFTMRWLLVAFAIATIAFYVLFIRPTIVAERFVRVIGEGDLKQAASMLIGDQQSAGMPHIHDFGSASSAGQLSRRTWSDIWHLRRTISVRTSVNSGDFLHGQPMDERRLHLDQFAPLPISRTAA
jgi:hypothetical protein